MTPFQEHIQRWHDCTRCPLHIGRNKVVFSRGKLPCDLLFVGEAPGKVEDLYASAFVGPAGNLLDSIIKDALATIDQTDLRLCFTNLVACLSLGDDNKATPPEAAAIQACHERLVEFANIAQPRLLICVGALAAKWLNPTVVTSRGRRSLFTIPYNIPRISIIHPSALFAMNEAMALFNRKKAVLAITAGVRKYLIDGEKAVVPPPLSIREIVEKYQDIPNLLDHDDDIPF